MRCVALVVSGGLLVGCSVTSDGSTGDPQSDPDADALGDGARVHELVGPATWLNAADTDSVGCSSPADRQVRITGQIIVGIDRYDETGDGALGNIYVQDYTQEPVPYSGMTIFGASFTPPDLRIFAGDVVDTFGTLTEFLGPSSGRFGQCKTLPEIGGAMTLRFDGGSIDPLTVVAAGSAERWQPLTGYENARQWLGMLVRVEGVAIAGAPTNSGGRYSAAIDMGGGISAGDVVKISNELYDIESEGPPLADGAQFAAVTGVLTYFYGFKIAPRSAADFQL
jgi:hypothetical protein